MCWKVQKILDRKKCGWLPCLVIYAQYVLFTRASELIVFVVSSPQFIRIVPEVVDTENAVMVLPAAGVAKVQIVAGGSAGGWKA